MKLLIRPIVLVCLLLLSIAATAMSIFTDESIPTKEKLLPVVRMEVDLLNNDYQISQFHFESKGLYRVGLVLWQTEDNMPPRKIQDRSFIIEGVVELHSGDKVIFEYPFKEEIKSFHTGAKLTYIEVDKKLVEESDGFRVKFSNTDKELGKYFKSVDLSMRRKLKHSIYD